MTDTLRARRDMLPEAQWALWPVGTPAWTEDRTLQVASFDDLIATKLKVILQRLEAKDYRDIAAMLESGVSLARGLGAASRLFGNAFQPAESLKALTWFHGGDLETLPSPLQATLVEAAGKVRDLPSVSLASTRLAAELAPACRFPS